MKSKCLSTTGCGRVEVGLDCGSLTALMLRLTAATAEEGLQITVVGHKNSVEMSFDKDGLASTPVNQALEPLLVGTKTVASKEFWPDFRGLSRIEVTVLPLEEHFSGLEVVLSGIDAEWRLECLWEMVAGEVRLCWVDLLDTHELESGRLLRHFARSEFLIRNPFLKFFSALQQKFARSTWSGQLH